MELSDNEVEFSDSGENPTKQSRKKRANPRDNQPNKKPKLEDINDSTQTKNKSALFKQPTAEELNQLKETENLYNNSLFRLQISELIAATEIKNKRKKFAASFIEKVQNSLNEIVTYGPISLAKLKSAKGKQTNLDKLIQKLKKYECDIKTDQNVTLNFVKPESAECFGLYELNALAGPNLICNINVTIPKSCFLAKDYLNNRYLTKRFYYLAFIAEHLKSSKLISEAKLVYSEQNILLPIFELTPVEACEKITFNLYATAAEDCFKTMRFLPEKNNLKDAKLFDFEFASEQNLTGSSTLLYNSTILHDITLNLNHNYIKETLKDQVHIKEGIKLLSVWLKQRELDNLGVSSFNSTLLVYFVVYLLNHKRINQHMSSYQIIRNFWHFFTTHDFELEALSLCENVSVDGLKSFKENFEVVLVDRSGCYNVACFLTAEICKKMKRESDLALKLLDQNRMDSFQALFITKVPFYLQFDAVFDLTDYSALRNHLTKVDDAEKAKNMPFESHLLAKYLTKILYKALNKRVLNIVPKISDKTIKFGLTLDPSLAFNFIEHGPALNDFAAAAEFRAFWGKLASDRRFRDGTTKVVVYFKTNTIRAKRALVKKILNFILKEKLQLKYKIYYDDFEEVLINRKINTPYPVGTNEESSLKVISESDALGQILRGLSMSLSITGLQGISDVFSYTDVFPPIATSSTDGIETSKGNNLILADKVPRFVAPVESVIQLEHSSKWPNNIEALRHIKTSFYLEISKMLAEKFEFKTHVTPNFIDIFYVGLVFRYRIYLPKEIALMKKELDDVGVTVYKDTNETVDIEKKFNVLPRINGALKGLQSQNPSYGPGTALIKRWLRSHLIDNYHFPDVVINLLSASLVLNASPFEHSNTPQIHLLRFLKFFSEFQCSIQTVVVNFNDELQNAQISEIEANLQANRDAFPPLFIIMPFDKCESIFTKSTPSILVLNRVKELATGTLKFVNGIVNERNLVGIKDIFTPNWEGYTAVIHLNENCNPRRVQNISYETEEIIPLAPFDVKKVAVIPIVNFDPVQIYLKELRANYGEFAHFFHDTYGGNAIGVLWTPEISDKEFKVAFVNGRKLVDEKLVFNVDAILDDFYNLGKDLVRLIERN